MSQLRLANNRPIKLRRLIKFHGSSSLAIVIPRSYVDKLGLRAGEYMAVELDEEGNSLSLNKCSVTAAAGEQMEEEDNND